MITIYSLGMRNPLCYGASHERPVAGPADLHTDNISEIRYLCQYIRNSLLMSLAGFMSDLLEGISKPPTFRSALNLYWTMWRACCPRSARPRKTARAL